MVRISSLVRRAAAAPKDRGAGTAHAKEEVDGGDVRAYSEVSHSPWIGRAKLVESRGEKSAFERANRRAQ